MKHKAPYLYLVLIVVLFLMVNIPHPLVDKVRGGIIQCFAFLKSEKASTRAGKTKEFEEIQRLQIENRGLYSYVSQLKELITQKDKREKWETSPQLHSVPAHIVFRKYSSWNTTLWIDVGEENDREIGAVVVSKNSPVVLGNAVVGVVDYVGKRRSRVRLITDPGLTPSVRAVRGGLQNLVLVEHVDAVLDALACREDLPFSNLLAENLQTLRKGLSAPEDSWFLAKGELYGCKRSAWRRTKGILRGTGFNYDFPDEKGPARDLRTGQAVDPYNSSDIKPILKIGDLLVTTGMDGVFPEGLFVATVTKVDTLREGGYYYDLEAKPVVNNIEDLSLVFVLPPVSH